MNISKLTIKFSWETEIDTPELIVCLAATRLQASAEEEELARDLFKDIGTNYDGSISLEKLRRSAEGYKNQGKPLQLALATALERLVQQRAATQPNITFEIFNCVLRDLPRVKAERVQFAQALGVHELVAGVLPKGSFFDGLEGLRKLAERSDAELFLYAHEKVALITAELESLLLTSIHKLRGACATVTSALEQNSKFSMDPEALTASFATLQQFYDGPEKLIGNPNPKAVEGIRREHCERKNADTMLTTPNYNITTSPRIEYFFVVDPHSLTLVDGFPHTPRDSSKWSQAFKNLWRGNHGRDILVLQSFTNHSTAQKAGLGEAEVVALRLYTGPMYIWYNAVLRRYPKTILDSLEGNRYETTIFCMISGIIKLSKLTEVPEDRRVYRGLGGAVLPDAFWSKSDGFRGGVELGFMSTTTDLRVAMQYSGNSDGKRSTVLEIHVGRVDIGADLSWVTQYPAESEVTSKCLPPSLPPSFFPASSLPPSLPPSHYVCVRAGTLPAAELP